MHEKNVSKDVADLAKNEKIMLPIDYRTENGSILDIGPKTEKKYEEEIAKARTIVWNGPMGMIEKEGFAHGTNAVARALAANTRAFKLVGGGETVMAVKKLKIDDRLSFISTGGGAMLDFLAGMKLPGLVALDRKNRK
jgi:phosphoglycerate kinase